MQFLQTVSVQDIGAIVPELELAVFGMFLLIFDLMVKTKRRLGYIALIGVAVSGAFLFQLRNVQYFAYGGSLVIDPLATFFKIIFLVAAALVIAISLRYLDIERESHGEYYALILFATMGMMFMAGATDLATLYIGLETMAIATYILVGFLRSNQRSNEASMKYFLLGAFSSAFLLYGMSILYGIAGSTRFDDIAEALSRRPPTDPISMMAMITLSAGMFFKVAAVPFHQWTPDAYEGAPTSITAFMSVALKVASFAILLRLLLSCIWPLRVQWQLLMIGVAVATMTLGNLAAITQTNIKRFFGYSTISHVGYLLLGVITAADGNETGLQAVFIYLLVYAFMNLGAFAVIIVMRRKDLIGDEIDDLSGLMSRSPGMAIIMLIFLLSLAGIPPTAGFIGKYFIFLSLIETHHYVLAVLAVGYAVVALYYYLRIVVAMFMKKAMDTVPLETGPGLSVALGVSLGVTLLLGIYPQPLIVIAREAIRPFFS